MTKRLPHFCIAFFLITLMVAPLQLQAQSATPTPPATPAVDFSVEIVVDSAFTRFIPAFDGEKAASVFIGDRLIAIGRNADGTWLEVQRPGLKTNLGWLLGDILDYEFDIAGLPITDGVTGLLGTEMVTDPYGVSILLQYEATLRAEPTVRSAALTIVPYNSTLPALEVYPDQTWVKVNYLGYVGWIAGYLVRYPDDLKDLPTTPGLENTGSFVIEIIPPEVQLAQVIRLREFVQYRRDLAEVMAGFWALVRRGDIVPCEPPGFIRDEYNASFQDYKELPELRRYLPRLNEGIAYLNYSIEILQPCGVYTNEQADGAYADAVNARIIFDATLQQLDNLEENIIPQPED